MENTINKLVRLSILGTLSSMLLLLSSCASTYPCGEPSTGSCSSVSTNYERSFDDYINFDDLDKNGNSGNSDPKNTLKLKLNFTKYPQTPTSGSPLISEPKMMRVWLTSYTDTDNVYHEQGYEYMITNRGDWLFGNNKPKINNNLKDISLIQGNGKAKTVSQVGFDPRAKPSLGNSTIPNNILSDYPAINALKNQNVPINHATSPLTGTVVNSTE